jgi:hypothetical protein
MPQKNDLQGFIAEAVQTSPRTDRRVACLPTRLRLGAGAQIHTVRSRSEANHFCSVEIRRSFDADANTDSAFELDPLAVSGSNGRPGNRSFGYPRFRCFEI